MSLVVKTLELLFRLIEAVHDTLRKLYAVLFTLFLLQQAMCPDAKHDPCPKQTRHARVQRRALKPLAAADIAWSGSNPAAKIVHRGDTVLKIAAGDPKLACAIAKCSALSDPNHIQIGWKLRVPVATPTGYWNWSGCAAAPIPRRVCARK